MRKRVLYFDLQKIERNDEPLCESEREVARHACFNPKPGLLLRLNLETALEKLTPRQRQAVDLIAQGHNEREIAQALGVSQPAVHKLLQKARVSLKKFLREGL